MRKSEATDGWHNRGYLPHFDGEEATQFVTFRLGDSLPQQLLESWRTELKQSIEVDREVTLRRRAETYLDQGHGQCHLKCPQIANLTQSSLLFFDGDRYRLSAWVIMPNHVHVLLTPLSGKQLSRILHSLKSYTANEANKILGIEGRFWQPETFDRYIRDSKHFKSVVRYIENNPVKARLCKHPEDWPYSSASFRSQNAEGAWPGALASSLNQF